MRRHSLTRLHCRPATWLVVVVVAAADATAVVDSDGADRLSDCTKLRAFRNFCCARCQRRVSVAEGRAKCASEINWFQFQQWRGRVATADFSGLCRARAGRGGSRWADEGATIGGVIVGTWGFGPRPPSTPFVCADRDGRGGANELSVSGLFKYARNGDRATAPAPSSGWPGLSLLAGKWERFRTFNSRHCLPLPRPAQQKLGAHRSSSIRGRNYLVAGRSVRFSQE